MGKEEAAYLAAGRSVKSAVESQMFGKPCFKINGKAFISFFEDEMVFKLNGDAHEHALSLKGSHLFDPSGKNRPMKEWVQVPYSHHKEWTGLAKKAKAYVEKSTSK